MNKMQGRKDGEKDRQNSRWGEEGASPTRRRLPCLEVHHVTAIKSGWMGRKCGMCAAETLVRASACEHFVWHRQHGGKALRSVCINRYSAHTDQWLDRRQGASAPECQNPAVCSRPPFFLCLSFLSPPSPGSLLFSRLPHHVFFLLSPVCYSSSFLTSYPYCRRFSLRSVVQHVSPIRRVWCVIFVPLKRF